MSERIQRVSLRINRMLLCRPFDSTFPMNRARIAGLRNVRSTVQTFFFATSNTQVRRSAIRTFPRLGWLKANTRLIPEWRHRVPEFSVATSQLIYAHPGGYTRNIDFFTVNKNRIWSISGITTFEVITGHVAWRSREWQSSTLRTEHDTHSNGYFLSPDRIPKNGIPIARPIPTNARPVQIFPQTLPIFSITSSSFILINLYMCYVEQLPALLASHQLGHSSYVMPKRIRRVSSPECKFLPCGQGIASISVYFFNSHHHYRHHHQYR